MAGSGMKRPAGDAATPATPPASDLMAMETARLLIRRGARGAFAYPTVLLITLLADPVAAARWCCAAVPKPFCCATPSPLGSLPDQTHSARCTGSSAGKMAVGKRQPDD